MDIVGITTLSHKAIAAKEDLYWFTLHGGYTDDDQVFNRKIFPPIVDGENGLKARLYELPYIPDESYEGSDIIGFSVYDNNSDIELLRAMFFQNAECANAERIEISRNVYDSKCRLLRCDRIITDGRGLIQQVNNKFELGVSSWLAMDSKAELYQKLKYDF